ncbi:Wzz/FepE/Etk N-terminal domain-containing protein [Flavobacterium sp. UMI-01]|uniref:Wzz/FepE/Etk N-terminal domain-containing protein n=1 Tax=Flavobacterium sp. UMI-01 TaxID=1441053 RepID=UPI001C7DF66B|nr:Wzz/FepE/Etk N-terminal domain-containing protein [Flavobacterium sp. UMI-01]GIZ07425.1 hypothetical protein FUMI01_01520 [Flavobacterium sp. UMI-01]
MTDPMQNDEISLKELILKIKEWYNYLLSNRKMIFLAGFLGALMGLGYSLLKKPNYTASLTFALEEQGSRSGGVLSLASQFGFDFGTSGGGAFTGANLIELFKSRSMIEKTLLSPVTYNQKDISLAEMYIEVNELRKGWDKKPQLKGIHFLPQNDKQKFTRIQDSILGKIYSNILKSQLQVVQKDKKIDIISIEVVSNHELFSKLFCEALAKEVSTFYVQTKNKKARENLKILQHQTDSVRTALNSAITGVAIATDNTFNLNPALNIRRTPSAKRQVDVQANTAILTEIVKQLELAKVTFRKETPLIQIIDRPILPLEKKSFGKLKGIIIGGMLFSLSMVFYLIIKRSLKQIME